MFALVEPDTVFLRIGIAVGSAGLLTLLVTPLVEWIAGAADWRDAPSEARWHETPTPHLGGIALFVGVGVALWSSGAWAAFGVPVWIGAGLLFAVGLTDDLSGLSPAIKLAVQLTSAGLVLGSGLLYWPTGSVWLAAPLSVVWLLGVTNALNLLDAMDGVAAGVGAMAAIAFVAVATLSGRGALAAVAGGLAAAEVAFLVYNAPPARIFMGDSGSLPLGYLLAVLGMEIQSGSGGSSPLVPVLILAVPLLDTVFVSATRLHRGQSVAEGGVDHTMHRLVRLGASEAQVAAAFWGAGAICGGAAVVAQGAPPALRYGITLGVVGAGLGFAVLLARWSDPVPPPSSLGG